MRLSDFELAIMNHVWSRHDCTAPDLHEAVSKTRNVTYSTVKTIVDRLERKGALKRIKQVGRTIFYRPAISPADIREPMLDRFVTTVFAGDTLPMVSQLLKNEDLSLEDFKYLENLLNEQRQKAEGATSDD